MPMFDYHDLDPKRAKERTQEESLKVQSVLLDEIRQVKVK